MKAMEGLFKIFINFTLSEFEELVKVVVLTIIGHVRSIWEGHCTFNWSSKLTMEQCLLNFILHMKHDNITKYDAFMWNWSKSAINDDGMFIASCINFTIVDEIRWPTIEEQQVLGTQLSQFQGYIGFINGTFIKIHRPWNNPTHQSWFNGWKKIYCLNNLMVLDHQGLFIYLNLGFPRSYYDVIVLWQLDIHIRHPQTLATIFYAHK
jgi:hypothetical protein